MTTKAEIKTKYKELHDDLATTFYKKKHTIGVTPEEQAEFDAQHKKIWDDCATEIKTASDYVKPTPHRDYLAEIDELKAKVAKLETREIK